VNEGLPIKTKGPGEGGGREEGVSKKRGSSSGRGPIAMLAYGLNMNEGGGEGGREETCLPCAQAAARPSG